MKANVGDEIRIRGHHVGEPDRCGQILAVRGSDGDGPFVVRWDDTGHEVLLFPGPDAVVRPLAHVDP